MSRELLLAHGRTQLSVGGPMTSAEIREMVQRISSILPGTIGDDVVLAVAEQLEQEFLVDLGPAHTLTSPDYRPWLQAQKHEISFRYWSRYKDFLVESGFAPKVVSRLDDVTDQILDLAGDPKSQGPWSRRGLVVGHVQSGKTANYLGLINKAADAGYKLIILIAGIHSNLRSQTQERVDQGFVGRDSDQLLGGNANAARLGVGVRNPSLKAVAYTSRAYDFVRIKADGLGISIDNLADPAIFVVKKNKAILTNLISWLKGTSGDRLTMPMLVIDDEADNASINIAADPNRPNAINALIRQLLNISSLNAYIGYTATPFANIFIDPDSNSDLDKQDLFPRDFIVGLDAPTNYVGAADYFLDDDPAPKLTVELEDADEWLPLKHKIDADFDDIPDSLKDAIHCFILSKAIRILRGQALSHHSMLVNVSRFTGVQHRVAERIREYLDSVKQAIENRSGLSTESALRDPVMRALHESWSEHYEDTAPESWPNIQKSLHQAAAGAQVTEVNARSGPGVLNFRQHSATGLNVIAVGGNALSRGFTLEGLTVSYFLRNTQMYDTLLQMGRWFGYRDGYRDLCRLFMKEDAMDWYSYIANATEELRDEIKKMEAFGLTPLDFGLAVRSHPGALLVTARNKMRSAQQIVREVGLANRLVETSLVQAAGSVAAENWRRTTVFIERLDSGGFPRKVFPTGSTSNRASTIFSGVGTDLVTEFIGAISVPPGNPEMSPGPLIEYARRRGFVEWDVVVASNTIQLPPENITSAGTLHIGLQDRKATRRGTPGRSALSISKSKRRVASRGLEAAGLSQDELDAAQREWSAIPGNESRSIADSYFRRHRTRPLLMLHFLSVDVEGEDAPSERHAAYGISFPALRPGEVEQRVEYTANLIAFRELYGDADAEGDEDDDYED